MISHRKRITAVLTCLALAVIAFGCGEKEEPATTGAVVTETTTSTTSTTSTTTGDPSMPPKDLVSYFLTGGPSGQFDVCSEGFTAKFLKQAYGGRRGCVASRKPNALAKRVEIVSATERSDRSTVVAKATGGVYGGDKLTFDLVKQGNQWLIDVLKSNAPVGP